MRVNIDDKTKKLIDDIGLLMEKAKEGAAIVFDDFGAAGINKTISARSREAASLLLIMTILLSDYGHLKEAIFGKEGAADE